MWTIRKWENRKEECLNEEEKKYIVYCINMKIWCLKLLAYEREDMCNESSNSFIFTFVVIILSTCNSEDR